MNKKKACCSIIFVICALCFVLAVLGALFSFLQVKTNHIDKKIFNDFSEFSEYSIKHYEPYSRDVSVDKDLGELIPVNFWCKNIEFEGETYGVYAYEFGSADESSEYFRNVSGQKNAPQKLCFFYQNTSVGKTTYVAYYAEYAYKVTGGKLNSFTTFMNHFCADFSIDIVEEYYKEYGIRLD